jgi:hypothetical protein
MIADGPTSGIAGRKSVVAVRFLHLRRIGIKAYSAEGKQLNRCRKSDIRLIFKRAKEKGYSLFF